MPLGFGVRLGSGERDRSLVARTPTDDLLLLRSMLGGFGIALKGTWVTECLAGPHLVMSSTFFTWYEEVDEIVRRDRWLEGCRTGEEASEHVLREGAEAGASSCSRAWRLRARAAVRRACRVLGTPLRLAAAAARRW